jgi:hypothetical protein
MYRYAVAIGLGIFMVCAIVAYAVTVPGPVIAAAKTSEVSSFDVTLMAKDSPQAVPVDPARPALLYTEPAEADWSWRRWPSLMDF